MKIIRESEEQEKERVFDEIGKGKNTDVMILQNYFS
jgi:hypothetical protein